MADVLKVTAYIINRLHDLIIAVSGTLGLGLSDKDLHFWLIGGIGMFMFLFTDAVFKRIAKWNISAISFVYTFTVLIVLVFGLEIEQKITGRGNMEFTDIVAGLWGFLVVFAFYLGVRIFIFLISKLPGKKKTKPNKKAIGK